MVKTIKIRNENGELEDINVDENYYVLYKVMKDIFNKLGENK